MMMLLINIAAVMCIQFYHRGVYDEPNCSTRKLTHAMLIVGYGKKYGKEYCMARKK